MSAANAVIYNKVQIFQRDARNVQWLCPGYEIVERRGKGKK
jgi:hypothetical protein